jgi:uncharacterized protein
MKRTTVDTNIFISALFWKGTPDRVIDVFKRERALLLLSSDILAELERKLSSAKFATRISDIGLSPAEIVATFRGLAEIASPVEVPEDAIRDPKDRMILACAVGGKADMIVSGDKDLLVLKAYRDIPIVTPAEFLAILNPPAEPSSDEPASE